MAWAVIWGAPEEPNSIESGTCTATETPSVTHSLHLVLFGSSIVGGLAPAMASFAERPAWARLLGLPPWRAGDAARDPGQLGLGLTLRLLQLTVCHRIEREVAEGGRSTGGAGWRERAATVPRPSRPDAAQVVSMRSPPPARSGRVARDSEREGWSASPGRHGMYDHGSRGNRSPARVEDYTNK